MSNSVLHWHRVIVSTKAAVVKRIVIHNVQCTLPVDIRMPSVGISTKCENGDFRARRLEAYIYCESHARIAHTPGQKRLACNINVFSLVRWLLVFRSSMQAPCRFWGKFIFYNQMSLGNALFHCCQWTRKRAQCRAPNIFRLPLWYYNQPNFTVFFSQNFMFRICVFSFLTLLTLAFLRFAPLWCHRRHWRRS